MAAEMIAVDVMRSHGDRTKTRLIELVNHYCAFYGEDEENALHVALDLAMRTVLDFDAES